MLLTFKQVQVIVARYGPIIVPKPKKKRDVIITQPLPMPSFRIGYTTGKSPSTGERLFTMTTIERNRLP